MIYLKSLKMEDYDFAAECADFAPVELKKPEEKQVTLTQEARALEKHGVVCVPLMPGRKAPAVREWEKLEKTPWKAFGAATKGFGIVCGKASSVVCVDIDNVEVWKQLVQDVGNDEDLENTPTVETPSGGLHYYFSYDPEITTATNAIEMFENGKKIEGVVDVRGDKGQVVAPPSVYYASKDSKKRFNGKRYKWVKSFEQCKPKECPFWLKSLLTKQIKINKSEYGFQVDLPEPPRIIPREDNLSELGKPEQTTTEQAVPADQTESIDSIDWEAIADNGEYTNSGEKRTLSIEQISKVVNNLNTSRFSNYDTWCKLLWAVARWQDASGADEDIVLDLLDDYCKRCENYGSRRDVEKKYNEAFKRNGQASKVSIGTLIHWLKEDNFQMYCEIFEIGKLRTTEVKMIDRRDPYCWVDFVKDLKDKVWANKQELDNFMKANVSRVLAMIQKEKGFYIKKDSCVGGMFSYVEQLKGVINPDIRVAGEKIDKRTKDKKPVKCIEIITLSDYLRETNILTEYADIGCYPDTTVVPCPPNFYNIWEGFKAQTVDKVDESKIADIQYILKELWASGDEALYKYILAWLRFVVANPAEMTKVALFLYSEEGAGKGTFIDFFMLYVLGLGISHSYTGIEEVVEKHNTNKKGKKLAYINEMGSTRDQFINNFDKIKTLITDPIVSENPKGRAIIQVDNITNVIMSTNHKNSLYIPRETDRRYTCIEVSDAKVGPEHKDWWGKVIKNIMNQECGNHFYTWLLSLDPTELPNPRVVFKTKLRDEIIALSRDNVLTFADWFLNEQSNKEADEKITEIRSSDLFSEYQNWCSNNGERAKSNRGMTLVISQKFKKEVRRDASYFYVG